MSIKMILCTDLDGKLGYDKKLLYSSKDDLIRFKRLTNNSTLVMGRKTMESLPFPLRERESFILTKKWFTKKILEDERCDGIFKSIDEVLDYSKKIDNDIWIIGGAEVYTQFFDIVDEIQLTLVHDIHNENKITEYIKIDNLTDKLRNFNLYKSVIIKDIDRNSGKILDFEFIEYRK